MTDLMVIFIILHLIGLSDFWGSKFRVIFKKVNFSYNMYVNRRACAWKAQIRNQKCNILTQSREKSILLNAKSAFWHVYMKTRFFTRRDV